MKISIFCGSSGPAIFYKYDKLFNYRAQKSPLFLKGLLRTGRDRMQTIPLYGMSASRHPALRDRQDPRFFISMISCLTKEHKKSPSLLKGLLRTGRDRMQTIPLCGMSASRHPALRDRQDPRFFISMISCLTTEHKKALHF